MEASEFNKILKEINKDDNAEKLYNTYYSTLVRILTPSYGRSDAEGAVQTVFISLLNTNKDFGYIEHPTLWLMTCCFNRVKNLSKVEARQRTWDKVYADEIVQTIVPGYRDCYLNQLECLNDEEKKILYLYHWCGFTHREVGEILNVPGATIRKRYSRAIKKAKKVYAQHHKLI